jgi:SAM-dependent methyltransferase
MEYVACDLCKADNIKLLFVAKERDWRTGEIFNIVRCNKCGLVYVNPRPEKNEIKKYYPPEGWPRAKEKIDFETATINNQPWREVMKLRTAHLLKYIKNGRILDIGCGDGFFLKYLKERGWKAYGVEPGEVASRYARDVLGIEVFTGNLEDANFPKNWFDAVSLYAVFEHLPDPSKTLKEINRILKPDGILFIFVPNFGGLELRIFRERWVAIKAPVHFYHFTPITLSQIVKKTGFQVLEIKHISSEGRCTMGYSESLRYILADYHLYPVKKYSVFSKNETVSGQNDTEKILLKKVLHDVEFLIFKTAAFIADILHMGGNLSLIASKKPS